MRAITPHEDYGFFGPGSATWKVWTYPTSLTVGFQRAVVVEELDPFLLAAVDATDAVRTRPRSRYDRTIRYFATVAVGDTRSAITASELLVKVHSRAVGIEPVSGRPYDANDPDSQLWIHLTGWHSVLYAYERYGPGKLTEAEEREYWQQCAVAAELQTCDPADVPRSRGELREYYAAVRPRLAASEATQAMMRHLLDAGAILPAPAVARPGVWTVSQVLRAATIATMPMWMRELGGLRQSRAVDAAVRPVMQAHFRTIARSPALQLRTLRLLSPATVPVVGPIFLGMKPAREETLSPAEARARHGTGTPRELWGQLRQEVPAAA